MPATCQSNVVLLGPAAIDPPVQARPIGLVRTRLGFPSPAEDFEDDSLDLNNLIVRNPPATFFYRAEGRSMEAFGIFHGDILSVDRSVEVQNGDLVLATWDGNGPACKLLELRAGRIELHSGPPIPPILIPKGTDIEVFFVSGVVRVVQHGTGRRDFARWK